MEYLHISDILREYLHVGGILSEYLMKPAKTMEFFLIIVMSVCVFFCVSVCVCICIEQISDIGDLYNS